jgi:hypothetical protein
MDAELPGRLDGGAAMNRTDPGLYGDLLYRDGELVVVRSLSGSVACPDWTADVAAHGHLMFLNIAMDPATGQVYASGKANVGSKVVIVGPDKFATIIPGGYGNYPSQLAVVDGRVVCYVVLNLTQYGLFDLAGTLLQTFPIPDPYHGTSQGIRFVSDDGAVCWGDQTIAGIFEGLVIREWMQRGDYTGGQGQDGGFALSGNGISTLYPSGTTFFPRIAVHDRELALLYVAGATVCWDTLTLPLEALPPVAAPKIAVESYDAILKAGAPWLLDFTNAGDGTRFQVTKDAQDRLWIAATNPSGHDQTGSVRQLTVEGPSATPPDPEPEPQPEPEPEPWPMDQARFWLQPNIGSKDLLTLFADPSPLSQVDAFVFYVQQIVSDSSNPQLGSNIYPNLVAANAFQILLNEGIPVTIEMGSIKPGNCDAANSIREMQTAVQRVHDAGGAVSAFSMDEPLTANQAGCHQTLEACATAVANYTHAVRALGPIEVGWLEAWPEVSLSDQTYFLALLKARDALPDYWHLDIDWNRAEGHGQDPAQFLRDAQRTADVYGVTLGVFVNATVDPIPTDAQHYANVTALGKRVHDIAPAIAHVCVASWAHRAKNDPTHATQNVPDNFGAAGMLAAFNTVRGTFEPSPSPIPEPEPEEVDSMLYKLMDPTVHGVIRLKQLKPLAGQPGKFTAVLPDDSVASIQPDGSFETRAPGTTGDYEQCLEGGNLLFYEPIAGKRYSWAYRLLPS